MNCCGGGPALFTVGGCGSLSNYASADPVVFYPDPDNHHGYAVHCDSEDNDKGECVKLAETVCRWPYHIRNGPLGPADAGYGKRLILVECDK